MTAKAGTFSARIAGAVRAELARRRRRGVEVAQMLGVTRTDAERRLNGDEPFDLDELEQIADAIGVDVELFFASAELGCEPASR